MQFDPRHRGKGVEPFKNPLGQTAQRVVVVALRGQRDGDNGNVVGIDPLDQRRGDVRRQQCLGTADALVDAHHGFFLVHAHVELHGNLRQPLHRRGKGVVHALDLAQRAFHRRRDQAVHFGSGSAGQRVDHLRTGDQNLRVFLARRQGRGDPADREAEQHEHRCELRLDEVVGDPAGGVEFAFAHARPTVLAAAGDRRRARIRAPAPGSFLRRRGPR